MGDDNMRIVLGSQSEKKIAAVKDALKYLNITDYDLECYKVNSNVSENPLNEETLQGARNRNQSLKEKVANADMYISIEAGFTKENENYYLDTYTAIEYENKEYIGMCPRLKISKQIYNYVKDGNVLHLLVQKLQNTETNDGVIGYLSKGKLKRSEFEVSGVVDGLLQALKLDLPSLKVDANLYVDDEQIDKLNAAIDENIPISIMAE